MSEIKLACIYSDTETALERYVELSSMIDFVDPEKSDAIIVLGGDGFMLLSVHEYRYLEKPFYGMNCGSVGFLLNEFTNKKVEAKIRKCQATDTFSFKDEG
jgi:NAD+ kinase